MSGAPGKLAGAVAGGFDGRRVGGRIRLDNSFGLSAGTPGDWSAVLRSRETRIAASGTLRDLLTPRDLDVDLRAMAPGTAGLSDLLGMELPALPRFRVEAALQRDGPRVRVTDLLALTLLLAGCGLPERVEREPAMDARLATRVKIALIAEGTLDAAAIFVDAENGVVRLGGFTDSPESRARAAAVAEAVPGVAAVQNAIALR